MRLLVRLVWFRVSRVSTQYVRNDIILSFAVDNVEVVLLYGCLLYTSVYICCHLIHILFSLQHMYVINIIYMHGQEVLLTWVWAFMPIAV